MLKTQSKWCKEPLPKPPEISSKFIKKGQTSRPPISRGWTFTAADVDGSLLWSPLGVHGLNPGLSYNWMSKWCKCKPQFAVQQRWPKQLGSRLLCRSLAAARQIFLPCSVFIGGILLQVVVSGQVSATECSHTATVCCSVVCIHTCQACVSKKVESHASKHAASSRLGAHLPATARK